MAILPKSKYSITSTATIARDILHSFLNIHFGLILSLLDYLTNTNLARKRYYPGTRAWLLNSPTILSMMILDHLQIYTCMMLAFFFDFSNPGKQKLENLLHSLANVINTNICSYVKAMLKQKPDFVDKKLSLSILEEIRNKIGDRADRISAVYLLQFLVYTRRPLILLEAVEKYKSITCIKFADSRVPALRAKKGLALP
ncbi:Uncharacterized protein HZ326_21328 [Fusarium oxysporum f. sp. albedinis]|nr:Uncharacterized protein HZ326_21328 [Fusarium oxysporum f. sp. albedinis]